MFQEDLIIVSQMEMKILNDELAYAKVKKLRWGKEVSISNGRKKRNKDSLRGQVA